MPDSRPQRQDFYKSLAEFRRRLVKDLPLAPEIRKVLYKRLIRHESMLLEDAANVADTSLRRLREVIHREHQERVKAEQHIIALSQALEESKRSNKEIEARLKEIERRVSERAPKLDSMTGLLEKTYFERVELPRFVRRRAKERRHENAKCQWAALWYLDIDRFKWVNDNLGHDVGDQLLHIFCRILRTRTLRRDEPHHLARVGGDEFNVLQMGFRRHSEAYDPASRLKYRISTRTWTKVHPQLEYMPLSTSIGVACLRLSSIVGHEEEAQQIADVWRAYADKLMLRAKSKRLSQILFETVEYKEGQLVKVEPNGPVFATELLQNGRPKKNP